MTTVTTDLDTRTNIRFDAELADRRLLVRGLVAAGLLGVAAIHLALLPETWDESVSMGAMFAALVVAATAVAGRMVFGDTAREWLAALVVAAGPIAGYVVTRTVSLPFDRGDVGNWLEPLGLAALLAEAVVVALSCYVLLGASGGGPRSVRSRA